MYIYRIIPLTHLPFSSNQVFDYFSKEKLEKGSIVEIDLAGKAKFGFVVEKQPVEGLKTYLKRLTFKLKPVKRTVFTGNLFTDNQVSLASFLAKYFASPLSLSFKKFFLYPPKLYKELENDYPKIDTDKEAADKKIAQKFFSESLDEKVFKFIDKSLKIGKQVLILNPFIVGKNLTAKTLSKFNPLIFTGKNSDALKTIRNGETRVVITDKNGFFLPFKSLGLIAVMDEDSEQYKFWGQRPLFHAKTAAEKLAELHGADLILISQTPSVETFFRLEQKEILNIK